MRGAATPFRGPMPPTARFLACTLVLGVLAGCDAFTTIFGPSKPFEPIDSSLDWELLKGSSGSQMWDLGFDGDGNPVAAINGGIERYTDADAWVVVGKTGSPTLPVQGMVTTTDGTLIVCSPPEGKVYKFPKGAKTWAPGPDVGGRRVFGIGVSGAIYLDGDDGVYYQAPGAEAAKKVADKQQFQSELGAALHVVGPGDLLYGELADTGVLRIGPAGGKPETMLDCHTKIQYQCRVDARVAYVDPAGSLYYLFQDTIDRVNQVYKQPAGGGEVILVANLPAEFSVVRGLAFATDGTVYLGGSTGGTSGPVYKFAPGDSKGKLVFTPPGNLFRAPDGRFYAQDAKDRVYRYKKSGV
ncbi:MAG: hypothetical protein JWM80_2561 [Cyanobacteria bacterium RYN_339]|nr:hypothetical protein [Cyanobacteria bacterium RYN_339]